MFSSKKLLSENFPKITGFANLLINMIEQISPSMTFYGKKPKIYSFA